MEMLIRLSAYRKKYKTYQISLSKDITNLNQIPYSRCVMLAPEKGCGYSGGILPVLR